MPLPSHLHEHLQGVVGSILSVQSVTGGDISEAYLIETNNERLFLKLNKGLNAYDMFQKEHLSLTAIGASHTIRVPSNIQIGKKGFESYLLMEYIESGLKTRKSMILFGESMARMHMCTSDKYGWSRNNYIGSFPQYNEQSESWPLFFAEQRLIPQLDAAMAHIRFEKWKDSAMIADRCCELLPEVKPSLLHGDLWSGNYLIDTSGKPYLIDPAVYYGDPIVDIAMSKLFGAFSLDFYKAYFNIQEHPDDLDQRIEIYQLYYLLVHLNLFGSSYLSAVERILSKYFD